MTMLGILAVLCALVAISVQWIGASDRMGIERRNHMNLSERLKRMFGMTVTAPAVPQASAPPTPAQSPFDLADPRIPPKARQRIDDIIDIIESIEARARKQNVNPDTIGDVHRMRTNHLPTLVKSYVDIPAEHRSEIFRQTQKSASVHLCESLDAMIGSLHEISRNLAKHDLAAFTTNVGFIGTRYGDRRDPFACE